MAQVRDGRARIQRGRGSHDQAEVGRDGRGRLMYFTENALAQLADAYATIDAKYDALYERYLTRRYITERGKEFGQQGFLRRLQSLKRCIVNVYGLLPPERNEVPDADTRHDAELQVQAFVFHV